MNNANEKSSLLFEPKPFAFRFYAKTTLDHFGERLKLAAMNYKPPMTKISLTLNPASLGTLQLTIMGRGSSLKVKIAGNIKAVQFFNQQQDSLKSSLSEIGFNNIALDFGQDSNSGEKGSSQDQQRHKLAYFLQDDKQKSETADAGFELFFKQFENHKTN